MSVLLDDLQAAAYPLTGADADYGPLVEMVGNARFVFLGAQTLGTHEFTLARADITRRLLQEKGFTTVVIEADWPAAYRVNCYVRGFGDATLGTHSLEGLKPFPSWMWRNREMLDFIRWLRSHNDGLPLNLPEVGFYGLDLYSLYGSTEAAINYLAETDPAAAQLAGERYACFDRFAEEALTEVTDPLAVAADADDPLENEVVQRLLEQQLRVAEYARCDGPVPEDELFYAEQEARLVENASDYYRAMFRGRVASWNRREHCLAQTLDVLVQHLDRDMPGTRVVVWAHNSHAGDSRATEFLRAGQVSLGQLAREEHGREVVLVGLTTHGGTVTAATEWGAPAGVCEMEPALKESYEAILHEVSNVVGAPGVLLNLRDNLTLATQLTGPLLQRSIGAIYRPDTELESHYLTTSLADQFDAVVHLDQTRAIEALE